MSWDLGLGNELCYLISQSACHVPHITVALRRTIRDEQKATIMRSKNYAAAYISQQTPFNYTGIIIITHITQAVKIIQL